MLCSCSDFRLQRPKTIATIIAALAALQTQTRHIMILIHHRCCDDASSPTTMTAPSPHYHYTMPSHNNDFLKEFILL
jgi:hypothetical protein